MPDDKQRKEFRTLLEASAIGWMFPIAMGLGFGAGYGLDKLFGTWPWLTAIFSLFGVIAAFINLFRMGAGKNGS
jgi:F0F1-type ATP synthase assembly protein I